MNALFIYLKSQLCECWETTPFSEEHSCQKGLFLDRVLMSPKTEKALAAAVTKLMAPMARVACGDKRRWITKKERERSEQLVWFCITLIIKDKMRYCIVHQLINSYEYQKPNTCIY